MQKLVDMKSWLIQGFIITSLWLVITKGNYTSLIVGIPFIILAVMSYRHLRIVGTDALNFKALPFFSIWFIIQATRGGIDITIRTLHLKIDIHPGFINYPMNIKNKNIQVFFANCVSLLPGTLSVEIKDNELILHSLNLNDAILSETRKVEIQVQRLFYSTGNVQNG